MRDVDSSTGRPPRHTHVTRDIKAQGICPACDVYWQAQAQPPADSFVLSLPDFLVQRFTEGEESIRDDANGLFAELEMTDRLLVEYAAKQHTVAISRVYSDGEPGYGLAALVLRDLARPYADHPDFQPEWRT